MAEVSITMAAASERNAPLVVQYRGVISRRNWAAYMGGAAPADLQEFAAQSSSRATLLLSLKFAADCARHGFGERYSSQAGQFRRHLMSFVVFDV
jgi:hypothetical protein